jgi:hypothetical protein
MVWVAYKKVRSNQGSAGVDQISMEEFDADRSKHLYKLWNRLASGSYFPPPVKEVEIPKKDGKVRKLGIPILHCKSKQQADYVLRNLNKRMQSCGLELHPEKTKLVYCKDYRRQGDHPTVKFDFLGYSFQPRTAQSKTTGTLFPGYDCAISIGSKKRIAGKMKELDIVHLTHRSIVGVAQFLEPYIRGWVNYYGRFRIYALNPVFQLLRRWLVMWARKRYKRYKMSLKKAYDWFYRIKEQFPGLFYHWRLGFS